jgi:hypothetical protein
MPILVQCPCGRNINAADQYAGKVVRCPECKRTVSIPQVAVAAEPLALLDVEVVPAAPAQPPAQPVVLLDVEVVSPMPAVPVEPIALLDVEVVSAGPPPLPPAAAAPPLVCEPEVVDDEPPFAEELAPPPAPESLAVPAGFELQLNEPAEETASAPAAEAEPLDLGTLDENTVRFEPLGHVERRQQEEPPARRIAVDNEEEEDAATYQMTAEGAALEDRVGDGGRGTGRVGELGNFYLTRDDRVVRFVALAPDNSRALGGIEDMVCVLNVRSGEDLFRFHGHRALVTCGCFSADGKLALTGDDDGDLFLWDVADGKVVHHLEAHDGPVLQVACAHGCALAVSVGDDGTARLWNLKRGKMLHHLQESGALTAVAISPDDSLVVTGSADGLVHLWQTQSLQSLHDLENPPRGRVVSVRFSHDGARLVAGGIKGGWTDSWGSVVRWDRRTNNTKRRYAYDGECEFRNATALAFAGNGDTMVYGGGPETTTKVLRGPNDGGYQPGRVLAGFAVGGILGAAIAASSDPGSGTTTIKETFTPFKIASVATGHVFKAFPGHMRNGGLATITCVNVGPNGERGISGGNDGRVQIWGLGWT